MSKIRINCPKIDCDFLGQMETSDVKEGEVINITAYDCLVDEKSKIIIEVNKPRVTDAKIPVIIMKNVKVRDSKIFLHLPDYTGLEYVVLENVDVLGGSLFVSSFDNHPGATIKVSNVNIYKSQIEVVSFRGSIILNDITMHKSVGSFSTKIRAADNIVIDNLCIGYESELNIVSTYGISGIQDLKLVNVSIDDVSSLKVNVVPDKKALTEGGYSDLTIENYRVPPEWGEEFEFNPINGGLTMK